MCNCVHCGDDEVTRMTGMEMGINAAEQSGDGRINVGVGSSWGQVLNCGCGRL